MSVTPFRDQKANYVKEVADLAMARQTLRSINCSASLRCAVCYTNRDRDPLFTPVSFPE